MKINIKFFTVLMLTLTTMPGLAEICPWDAIGTYPECNCNSGKHEVPTNSSSHYIQYNSKDGRNQCDEWIELLDSDCIHQGSAPQIRNYNKKNIPQKGKCLIFGDKEETRRQVRTLVKNYNSEINKKRALPTGTNNAIIFGNQAEVYKWEGRDGKEGQPSIKAIIRGYTALCKRNGDGFEFKRIENGNTTSYVCQGTKASEQTAQQSTEQKTTQTTQNNTPVSDVNVCENPEQSGKICVYDLTTQKNTPYTFNINAAKNRKKDIKSIVYEYNNIAMQNGFILPIGDIVGIVDKTIKNASAYRNTLEQESSINAVVKGYKILCERNVNHNGVTSVDFVTKNIGYGYICRAATCNETTYTHDAKKFICVPKPATSRQSAQIHPDQTSSTQQDDTNNDKSLQPSEEERPEHENIEKLKPDNVALNPVAVNANDIEIKEPIIQPSEEERPEHENIEKLKPDDVALNPVAVNAGDVKIKEPAKTPLTQKDCDKYNMILDNGVCRKKTAEEEKKEFSGLVVDENNEPLIGATIQNISSPSEGTTTDLDGNFSCELTGGDNPKVRISYTGYKTQEITLGPDPVRVQLVPENQTIDEVQVVDKIPESMQKCTESGGEWITGNTAKGEKSYCECNEKILDNGVCRERTAEEACDYEGGKWTGTTCDCPEGEEWKVQYEQCVPKDDSEVKKNNESAFDTIVKAFEEKAKQLKDQKCGQQQ